jgi:hypothetical protein
MHQVTPVAAPGIDNAHAVLDVAAQYLIEQVNVDLPKLLLNA